MIEKVKSFIETEISLPKNSVVVVGFSGGADSVVLIHLLHQLDYHCIAAHCNFHLRMEESNRDEAFVRNFCRFYNIDLYTVDFDTVEYAKTHKLSIEMAARELRYNWFEEIRKKTDANAIAVAHHADDNAETLLLNLVRGTGIRGLKGISAINGNVIRPLLCVQRKDIEEYAKTYSLDFVTDSTNLENEYQRNKIRNIIIPLLSEINPSVVQTLNDNAKRFESTYRVYEQFIEAKKSLIVEKNSNDVSINIELLKSEPEKHTLLYEFCRDFGFHADQIDAIIKSIENIPGKIWYSSTHKLLKDRKCLIISVLDNKTDSEVLVNFDTDSLHVPRNMTFKHMKKHSGFQISRSPNCVHLDAGLLKFPLKIRRAKTGDSFIPYGMKGRKKLSDFFTDLKLNANEKSDTHLLISDNNIVWVIGYRVDNRFCVTHNTTDILEIRLC